MYRIALHVTGVRKIWVQILVCKSVEEIHISLKSKIKKKMDNSNEDVSPSTILDNDQLDAHLLYFTVRLL